MSRAKPKAAGALLLPADHLSVAARDGAFVPTWLGPEDHPWLAELIDRLASVAGRPWRVWRALSLEPLRSTCATPKRRMATKTLEQMCRAATAGHPEPVAVRARVFGEAQRARDDGRFERGGTLATAATALGIPPADVVERLYADLADERGLVAPSPMPDPRTLALSTNRALAQGLLARSTALSIEIGGQSRPIVRQILLKRLLCTVRRSEGGVVLDVSGPFALFRRTTLYGSALASLVPVLRGASSFAIHAECILAGRPTPVTLTSGDPIVPPGPDPRRHDSRLEAWFAKDFAKLAPDWDIVREPEPVVVDETYIFPDFALQCRTDPRRRWLVEIVGFWTPDYLEKKLDRLRRAGRRDLVLCVDASLACADVDLPPNTPVIRFRRRVDAAAVLAAIDAATAERIPVRDLFIDYAGRRPASDPIHARLADLRPGSEVRLVEARDRVFVVTLDGGVLAAMSSAGCHRWTPRLGAIRTARVAALVERRRDQTTPAWQEHLRVARWLLPLVEVDVARVVP
jgi:predicted nuclease of restriction endonuclease-like RecB superfamily